MNLDFNEFYYDKYYNKLSHDFTRDSFIMVTIPCVMFALQHNSRIQILMNFL